MPPYCFLMDISYHIMQTNHLIWQNWGSKWYFGFSAAVRDVTP